VTRAGAVLAAVALAAGFIAGSAAASAAERLTREEALAGVGSDDLDTRRRATAWLGEVGVMSDASVLIAALSDPDEIVRTLAEHAVWQVWSRSGDPDADGLLQVGIEQMSRGDHPAAVATFTAVIERRPDFAEAWNKRATVHFLMGEHEQSLRDCDEVMKRNPAHFGALAGYGQIYLQLDDPERALTYFRRALGVNPNLRSIRRIIPQLEQLLTERRKRTI
jgi:tetratricopeptide (TPR) repeat protein